MLNTTTVSSPFLAIATSGSIPYLREASWQENVKYDIGGMVLYYRSRLLVICDMHGKDLREVTVAGNHASLVQDGRAVVTAAIRSDFSELDRKIGSRISQADAPAVETRITVGKIIRGRQVRLLAACSMKPDDVRSILGTKALERVNISDGRAVMREALFREMNMLSRDIQAKLDALWPLKR